MEELPHEAIVSILSFLDCRSLLYMREVNKFFNGIASDETLWENLCLCKGEDRLCGNFFAQRRYEEVCKKIFNKGVNKKENDVFDAKYCKNITGHYFAMLSSIVALTGKMK